MNGAGRVLSAEELDKAVRFGEQLGNDLSAVLEKYLEGDTYTPEQVLSGTLGWIIAVILKTSGKTPEDIGAHAQLIAVHIVEASATEPPAAIEGAP